MKQDIRAIPSDNQTEQAVIGCCLISKQALIKSIRSLSLDSFYFDNNKIVFNCISNLVKTGKNVDIVTVMSELGDKLSEIGGVMFLTDATGSVPSTGNIDSYIDTLEKLRIRRGAISVGHEIAEMGFKGEDDLPIKIRNKSILATEQLQTDATFEDTLSKLYSQREEFRRNLDSGTKILGVSTGIDKLDKATLGIRKGKFYVIGGQTSAGKTQLTLNILNSMLKTGSRVLFMSIEMDNVDVLSRMAAIESGEDINSVLLGYNSYNDMELSEVQKLRIQVAEKTVCAYNIKINQNSNWSFLSSRISEIEALGNFDTLVIDFIQNIEDSEDEYKKLNTISNRLQSFAKNTGCSVIATSQISRDAQTSKRVDTSVFKGSGGIAEKADVAIVLHYDKSLSEDEINRMKATKEPLPICVTLVKNRGGNTGTIDMRFDTHTGRFLAGTFDDLT